MIRTLRYCSVVPTTVSKLLQLRLIQSSAAMQSKVAVVLAGCGVYDGSEVHEASAVLVHLSRAGAQATMFAPDVPQMHTINHTKGEPSEETRNVLIESARIARGKVAPLSNLNSSEFDAVIVPGGFGAAKNLSTFAVDAKDMKVNPEMEKVLKEFHAAKKPIGMCCIAPVIAAKVFEGCSVTLGSDKEGDSRWPYAGACQAVDAMKSKYVVCDVNEIHTDEANKIVTTPAFMCETDLHEIHDGIGVMVNKVVSMSGK